MSYSYERVDNTRRRQIYGASGRRSTLGYWIPLALTVTVATAGLVAWIWKERREGEEFDDDRKPGPGPPPPVYGNAPPGPQQPYARGSEGPPVEDESVLARMSGALRRTPSPQQLFDGASRRVAAGVAAAGAVVGGALSSIKEEDKRDFEDHSTWAEEAQARASATILQGAPDARGPSTAGLAAQQPRPKMGSKRKAVAIVISAETKHHHPGEDEVAYIQAHASILSHLPEHIDDDCRVFILIYAPDLKEHPLAPKSSSPNRAAASLASSYSNIGHDELHTPGEETEKPLTAIDPKPEVSPPRSNMFNALYAEAQGLVEKETMILPFTTPTGYVHLLKHIGPEVVYVQSTLAGPGGDAVKHTADWVGQVVLVVGDDTGHGGLVDSEDERYVHGDEERDNWWQNDPKIGLGKGIEVVDGLRIGEDWRRRVRGHD